MSHHSKKLEYDLGLHKNTSENKESTVRLIQQLLWIVCIVTETWEISNNRWSDSLSNPWARFPVFRSHKIWKACQIIIFISNIRIITNSSVRGAIGGSGYSLQPK